jgi:uncharacterized protein Usg
MLGKQLFSDYRLTTAEILYRLPDHPALLQSYVWQELDLSPEFPELRKFLGFWERELEGRLFAVRVASVELVRPADLVFSRGEIRIH